WRSTPKSVRHSNRIVLIIGRVVTSLNRTQWSAKIRLSHCPETAVSEVSVFSSYAALCGDIFISGGPRFSPYGDSVNLSRFFFSPAILTLRVNPHKRVTYKGLLC